MNQILGISCCVPDAAVVLDSLPMQKKAKQSKAKGSGRSRVQVMVKWDGNARTKRNEPVEDEGEKGKLRPESMQG
jgi:hypothetical protein